MRKTLSKVSVLVVSLGFFFLLTINAVGDPPQMDDLPAFLYKCPCSGWTTHDYFINENYYWAMRDSVETPPPGTYPVVTDHLFPNIAYLVIGQPQSSAPVFDAMCEYPSSPGAAVSACRLNVSEQGHSPATQFNRFEEIHLQQPGPDDFVVAYNEHSWSARVDIEVDVCFYDWCDGDLYSYTETFSERFDYQEYTLEYAGVYEIIGPSTIF